MLLKRCVAHGRCEFMTYGEFGRRFDLGRFPPAWANSQALGVASSECKAELGLDLTFLIRNSRSHYPSVIDGKPFDKDHPGPQIARAREEAQRIIDRFAPGTRNPY